ncbi:MAG: DegV family protein [Lachnospiraceae bacterium]|nr:DegV family protein [Lachnospiraceae bacterium]
MNFKIVLDSGGEIPAELQNRHDIARVPLILHIGDEVIIDDGTVSQKEIIDKIAAAPTCPKTAAPSPETYRAAYDCGAEHVYAVTLSANLSSSYQSAEMGRKMLEEEKPGVKIHVFNSCSASIGETLIAMKIIELEESGLSFEEVVAEADKYVDGLRTYFVLDNLETLRKNGRLSLMKLAAAQVLNIKPICASTQDGQIEQIGMARGMKKALAKMADLAASRHESLNRRLGISYANASERAGLLKQELMSRMDIAETVMAETNGLSTVYANDGGVIMCV